MKRIVTFMALAACSTMSSATELLTNGGFEQPAVSGTCCTTSPTDPLPGWLVTPDINVVIGTFQSSAGNLAKEGNQYLDLVGQSGTGGISQSFATVLGQMYTLSFWYSHNLFNSAVGSASGSFSVGSLNGIVSHSTGSNSNLDWQRYSGNFTGTGSPLTLSFNNLTGGRAEGLLLDQVSVRAAVPEPGTWLQLLLGFGVIGGTMRVARRRRRSTILQMA